MIDYAHRFFISIVQREIMRRVKIERRKDMENLKRSQNYDRELPMPIKIGFGVANLGDTIVTEFVGAFLIYFLTNVVGMRPALAGLVVFIGVLWDGISDPIIGTLSDRSTFKSGQRRPFLLMSVLPIIIFTTLLFTSVNLSGKFKFIYYTIMVIFYWTSYTLFNIPYLALGSELTTNNDEKTKISSVRQVFGTFGLLFANALPMILVTTFKNLGMSESRSWTVSAFILGIMAGTAILITWRTTKGWEIKYEPPKDKEPIFKNLGKILRYKPYVLIIIASFLFYSAFNICNSTVIYNTIAVIGAAESDASVVYLAGTIVGIILSIVLGMLAVKFDKKWVFVTSMSIGGISLLLFKFIGFSSILAQAIQFSMAHFGIIAFLLLSYNLIYDTAEVYEFKTGEMVTGIMISYFSFFIKLGKATALQVVGIILDISGYNANLAIQPDSAKTAIINMSSIIPGVLMLLCAFVIGLYPISKSRFQAMQNAKKLRDAGKEYSTEEFKQLL